MTIGRKATSKYAGVYHLPALVLARLYNRRRLIISPGSAISSAAALVAFARLLAFCCGHFSVLHRRHAAAYRMLT